MSQLMTLHQAEEQLCSAITADNFFDVVADTLSQLIDSDVALLAMIETGNPVLDIVSVCGDKSHTEGKSLLLTRDGEGKALLRGELVEGYLSKRKADSIHPADFLPEDHFFLTAPILSENKIVGVIEVFRRSGGAAFSSRERQKMADFGSFTGVTFANYQIFNQIYTYAVTKEQNRISKEMHDHICQQIGFLKIQAALLDDDLSAGKVDEAPKMAKDMRRVLDTVYTELREEIDELRGTKKKKKKDADNPAIFYKSIGEMLQRFHQATGISAELMIAKEAGVLYTKEVAAQLTMIIQEALTNVQRHAEAKGVLVMFKPGKDGKIMLTIEDNGKGFTHSEIIDPDGHEHYGLKIMRERAECVHADFYVESKPGEGTIIRVIIPDKTAEHDASADDYIAKDDGITYGMKRDL